MFAVLKNLVGLGLPRNKGIRRAERPRTRLELEALDQRLLPSTVPNLSGLTMVFNPWSGNNTLAISSVQDQGGGKGTFAAVYYDSRDGVLTGVSGTITLKGMISDPWFPPGYPYGGPPWYDFGVTFSGSATHIAFYPSPSGHGNIRVETVDYASGSGDFDTTAISSNPVVYQLPWTGSNGNGAVEWAYFGQESDSLSINGVTVSSAGGSVTADNLPT